MLEHNVKSIYLEGGEHGVLLLHGFTSTNVSMRYLGERLQKAGFTVSAPLLAGHGTHYQDLEKTTWKDWYQSVEDAFQELHKRCKTVMVAGLSAGGLLAAHLCHRHPRVIRAASLMATPIFLDGFLIRVLFPLIWKTPLKRIFPYQNKIIASIRDPEARKRHVTYHKVPIASVATFLDLQKVVRKDLNHFHQPLLLMHALDDRTVPYGNMDYIQAMVASEDIEAVTLTKSNHIITVDYEKDIVAKKMISFFKKHL